METNEIESLVEAILFAAGEPVKISKISSVLGIDEDELKDTIENYAIHLTSCKRGISIITINDSLQMISNPCFFEKVKLALSPQSPPVLTPALLEVLSIVAYNQPVTKSTIDKIRGTTSGYLVNKLVEIKMLTEKGRLNAPGKPILYVTTEDFLRSFCLRSLEDLPQITDDNKLENATNNISV